MAEQGGTRDTCINRAQCHDMLLVSPHRAEPDSGGVQQPRCPHNRQGELWVSLVTHIHRARQGSQGNLGCVHAKSDAAVEM